MSALNKKRIDILDALRGVAVVAMIVHHTMVLLIEFFGIYIDFVHTDLFRILQMVFVSIFLLVSGICTNYSRGVARRGLIIFGAALIVTLVTAVILPAMDMKGLEIYFGILHMFGVSMLLYAVLEPLIQKIPTAIGTALFAICFFAYQYWTEHTPYIDSPFHILALFGFPARNFYSADYYPILPYFFMFVCGAMIGRWIRDEKFPAWFYRVKIPVFNWIGRNSLWIYLVHQPIILGILLLFFQFIGK